MMAEVVEFPHDRSTTSQEGLRPQDVDSIIFATPDIRSIWIDDPEDIRAILDFIIDRGIKANIASPEVSNDG